MVVTFCCSTVTFCGGCGSGLQLGSKYFVVVVVVVVVSDVFSSFCSVIHFVAVVVVVVVAVVNSFIVLVESSFNLFAKKGFSYF